MNWQNLIAHRADVDPLELLPQEHNFRIHAQNQRQVTTASLDELGHVGDIIVNIRTGKIVNGHLRVELAIAEDQRTVPVTYIDCDVATEQIILAFFDRVGAKAITDSERLRATIAQIDTGSSALQASLDDWVLSFKPKKAKQEEEEVDEALDEEEFLDALPHAPAPEPMASPAHVAPAPASIPTTVEQAEVEQAEMAGMPTVAAPQATAMPIAPEPEGDTRVARAEQVAPTQAQPLAEDAIDDAPEATAIAVAVAPLTAVVQDDLIGAALVEDVRAAAAADAPPVPPALITPVAAAPTEYLIKIGEFDQMIPAAQFAPWFAQLCAKVGNGQTQLQTEIKQRLDIA